jgi:hypothetical protein
MSKKLPFLTIREKLFLSIREALACLPRELLSIIGDYGSEWPHKWTNDDGSQSQTAVIIAGNRLTSRAIRRPEDKAWYRIVSTQTIKNGPKRWKVRFSCLTAPVCIAVGITIGGGDNGIRRTTGGRWSDAATAEDVLITALMRPSA